jgi:hypothetical protein
MQAFAITTAKEADAKDAAAQESARTFADEA